MQQSWAEGDVKLVSEARHRAKDSGAGEDDKLKGRPASRAYDVQEEGEVAGHLSTMCAIVAVCVDSFWGGEALTRHNGEWCFAIGQRLCAVRSFEVKVCLYSNNYENLGGYYL